MRTFVSVLLLATVSVSAGEFVDQAIGLRIEVPDGWNRDEGREKGTVKFAGSYTVTRAKYVTLVVEAVAATGFSADDWLGNEKKYKASRYISDVTEKFTRDQNTRIGGLEAAGYTFGGKAKDREGTVRFKVYGVIHGEIFFQITESSFNGAHEQAADQLKEIWDGISFQEGGMDGDDGEDGGSGTGVKPASGEPTAAEDTVGNYKTKLPPGWEIIREAPTDKDIEQRMTFVRKHDDYSVASIYVFRMQLRNAATFNTGTPNDVLINVFHKGRRIFEQFFGEGSSKVLHPQMDEGIGFGGASKAGGYEIRSITMEEMAEVAAAEKKIKKGIKDVTVPEFKPKVVRGRLAMVSPYVYFTLVTIGDRSLNEDPQLVAEIDQIHEAFELLTTKAAPPPLEVLGKKIGDTTSDKDLKARKESAAKQIQGRKTYRVEYTFTLPAGWDVKNDKFGGDTVFIVWAQDGKNNWITVSILAVNLRKASEERKQFPKEIAFGTWRSNWTGKARGTKIPNKRQKFALGKVRGEGYKALKGRVSGFRGTFTGLLSDKFPGKGWRTYIEIETRADGDTVFAASLKQFLKSLKAKDIKVK